MAGDLQVYLSMQSTMMVILFLLYVYIQGGRAKWVLLTQVDPNQEDFFYDALANNHPGALFTKYCFIAFWPAFIALGALNALRERIMENLSQPRLS